MKPLLSLVLLGAITVSVSPALPAQEASAPMHHEHAAARPSTTLTVSAGETRVVLSLAELQAMPQTSVTVLNGHTKQDETYSGPLVSDVLARAGVVLSTATEHAVLRSYVVAGGTDGYFVVYSGAELQEALHKGRFVIAIAQNGQPLLGNGAFQLIDSLEAKPARWVRNLNLLSVFPVALPQIPGH